MSALFTKRQDARFAYVAPQFNQAKDVAWLYVKRLSSDISGAEFNESELRVDYPNGSRVRLYGADNPDRLRGLFLDGVLLDEYADMRPSVWGEVIRPMLADRAGWATFIGTPKGRNEFFEIHERAKSSPAWFSATLRASDTGILAEAELADAKRDMTPEQYDQEFNCSFDAAILGAYYGKDVAEAERAGRIRDHLPIEPSVPVRTAWDLGNSDHMAIWCWQMVNGEIRVVDYIQEYGYFMERYCEELNLRGYHGTDHVPHDAKVPSMETGRTRIETLLAKGRKPRLIPDHHVEDRINSTRVTFPRIYFDGTKCAKGIEALRQYRADYDEKLRTFKDTPKKDWAAHPADAFGYMCMAWKEETPKPEPDAIAPVKAITDYKVEEMWKFDKRPRDRV